MSSQPTRVPPHYLALRALWTLLQVVVLVVLAAGLLGVLPL